jgi:hypothetical protein
MDQTRPLLLGKVQTEAPMQPTRTDHLEAEPVHTAIAQADFTTPAGFQTRRGARLIEGHRPTTWLADAIAREHEITRRMGLLDRKPAKGANVA